MSSDPTASDDPDLDGMPTRGAREHLQLFRNHLGEAAHHLWQAAVVSSGCWEPGSPVRAAAAHAKTCMRVLPTATHSRPLVGEDEVGASEFRRCDCLNSMDVIYPYEPWKQRWDMMIALLILYAAITVPVRIGFQVDAEGWVWTFEMLSSLVFIVDVIFTFRTAYIIDYSFWETRSLPIAQKYMSGWFWIDAPSSIPIELLELVVGEASADVAAMRMLRLFRLIRLLKLFKMSEMRTRLEDNEIHINLHLMRLVTLVCQLLYCAHLLGCGWFYTTWFPTEDGRTWLLRYDAEAADREVSYKYMISVYWALTTLTTVGYGDITPQNNLERMYSCLALLTGSLVFATMLASVNSLVAALDRQGAEAEEKLDQVKEYMRFRNLPRDLVVRMRRYYTYFYSHKTVFDESDILGNLTPSLRYEVVTYALKETIQCIPLFKALDPEFQAEVFPLLKPMSASPREIIYSRGDRPDGLFFLLKGQVEVISSFDGRVLYRVGPHRYFGESAITGRRRNATHRAMLSCDMIVIFQDQLMDLFQRRPHESAIIRTAVLKEHHRKERLRYLSLRLLINWLEGGSKNKLNKHQPTHAMKMEVSALRIQIAWSKYLDRVYNGADPQPKAAIETPPTVDGATSAAVAMQLKKLDKLDQLDRLYAKLEQLLERSAPRSTR